MIRLKLSPTKSQYTFLASFFRTLAEGIILGSLAAFFLPETLQMKTAIPPERFALISIAGLTSLFFGVMLQRKGR